RGVPRQWISIFSRSDSTHRFACFSFSFPSHNGEEEKEKTSDLGNSFPIETLEEEIESSNGDSAASESSSDDEEAERHDVVADGANVGNKQTSISGIQLPPEILGFPEHHLHPDSGGALPFEKSQVNPNPSISAMNLCSEVDLCSNEQDNASGFELNHASLQESPCPRGFAPSTSLQTPLNPDNGNPDNGSNVSSAQYIWKPKIRKRNSVWQRVSNQNIQADRGVPPSALPSDDVDGQIPCDISNRSLLKLIHAFLLIPHRDKLPTPSSRVKTTDTSRSIP
ncbi:hypothetical protein Dimus_036747, partial [Dionaea muscipula]